MWVRVLAKSFAIFGLYAVVLSRIATQGGSKSYSSSSMLEIAAVTVLFVVGAVFLFTRRSRVKPPIE